MLLHSSIGSVPRVSRDNLQSAALIDLQEGKMGMLNALTIGDAVFRANGIRVHVRPFLSEYKVTMMWHDGGLYEGQSRISKLYAFLRGTGIPLNTGWEVFHV
jgi:hypothetical protein